MEVAGVFDGRDDGSPMVARLAGPLPVRLVEVSSLKVTSRTWWCASMDQCSRDEPGQVSCAVASALVKLVTALAVCGEPPGGGVLGA